MIERKPYMQPQLFRIELNQEQAILSACSLATNNANQGGSGGCRPAGIPCKRRNGTFGQDSAFRPS